MTENPEHKHECPHDPRIFAGKPIGMYHCPECGEMVLAGQEHPLYNLMGCEKCDDIMQKELIEYYKEKNKHEQQS